MTRGNSKPMMLGNGKPSARIIQKVRCAVYTRKSSEEGLEQEFNSLDAQRDSGEAFVASQQHEGWVCLPDHYDDGGFTGANMDRPALQRLMADIEAGKVDCVVVYKVDRLSRSLLDFARIMEVFERQRVSFVSVTQQFNTATSMGRLILNVLLSFAQFEREMISERTRDKIAAAKRKGKYVGGTPLLGYDVVDSKLVVNEDEAIRVRQIFRLYLEHEALLPTLQEIERRDWRIKQWITKKGRLLGGQRFTKSSLYCLLTNALYVGKIKHHSQLYDGEHRAIVTHELFQKVQEILKRNRHQGGADVRNRYGALLRGLLFCTPCGCSMTHVFTTKGSRRYRYYVCLNAQKRGREHCPGQSIPLAEIERFVVDEIRSIGQDPNLIDETLRQAQAQAERRIQELRSDSARLRRQLQCDHAELRKVAAQTGEAAAARLADLQRRIDEVERHETQVQEEIARLERQLITREEVEKALAEFDPLWDSLSPRDQIRVLRMLIERIDYDGQNGEITITLRDHGIKELAEQFAASEEFAA